MEFDRQYEDVLRRAELFSRIVSLVDTVRQHEPKPIHTPANRVAALADLPRILVVDRRVSCDGLTLDLARRPLTLRLFQLFVEADGEMIQRDDLVSRLYEIDASHHSERFVESLLGNAIKLISRSRALAGACLTGRQHVGMEWFPYDQERKCWSLYRLLNRYWLDRLS